MMGRDLKAQLGARVPAEVRNAAVAKAKLTGESLNAYVERLIVQDVGGQPSVAPLAGQKTIDDVDEELGGGDGQPVPAVAPAELAQSAKPFDKACRNGTYHFQCGPGRPCKFCGGEI
jgi:hypothetical protein